jgi:hypothetical protein
MATAALIIVPMQPSMFTPEVDSGFPAFGRTEGNDPNRPN